MEQRMRFAKARLVMALLALFAWLGYIAYQTIPYYQAKTYGRFPVISHSQLLVSNLVVVAELKADANGKPEPSVHVEEVPWPPGKKGLAGKDLTVPNLVAAEGFNGAGRYIVPLVAERDGRYYVAGLPRSPGVEHSAFLIYPDTPLTREELEKAPKPPVGS
jgi:hypothetical protein